MSKLSGANLWAEESLIEWVLEGRVRLLEDEKSGCVEQVRPNDEDVSSFQPIEGIWPKENETVLEMLVSEQEA